MVSAHDTRTARLLVSLQKPLCDVMSLASEYQVPMCVCVDRKEALPLPWMTVCCIVAFLVYIFYEFGTVSSDPFPYILQFGQRFMVPTVEVPIERLPGASIFSRT